MVAWTFLANLLATILIEGLIMLLLYRQWTYVYYTCLCNLLTNPAVNLLLLFAANWGGVPLYTAALVILEMAAVIVEAIILSKLCLFNLKRAMSLSALMNAASFLAGLAWAAIS